ncbi:MAG: DUF899 domain-containing protein [Candidatus Acidiferrum sp.]
MTQSGVEHPKVVSQLEWLAARKELLAKEKALTRQSDALAAERRNLPWVKVEKEYVFDTPRGKKKLADLFEGRSQLVVYHFMFGPDWEEGCPSCSILGDHIDGSVTHLANRDVTLIAISRAPVEKIEAFKKRMGWRFRWASSFGSEFNRDYHVSFTPEEMAKKEMYYNFKNQFFPSDEGPGLSVFCKNEKGEVFHTYSTYGRGGEPMMGVYHYLDVTPRGRHEEGLSFPMAWRRHHDRYEQDYYADGSATAPKAMSAGVACCGEEHKAT